jgi:hypothetical protein
MAEKEKTDEGEATPVCPHCEAVIDKVECCWREPTRQPTGRFAWAYPGAILVSMCPSCRKVLGTFQPIP